MQVRAGRDTFAVRKRQRFRQAFPQAFSLERASDGVDLHGRPSCEAGIRPFFHPAVPALQGKAGVRVSVDAKPHQRSQEQEYTRASKATDG